MRLVLGFLMIFAVSTSKAADMSYPDAFNIVHQVMSQVALNAGQHARVEQALSMIKELVAKRSAEEVAKVKKRKDDAIIKAYLEGKKNG